MKAYKGESPAYFATPPVNLIRAAARTTSPYCGQPKLDERLKRHRETSSRIKAAATLILAAATLAVKSMGLIQAKPKPRLSGPYRDCRGFR
jgi:aspartate aminotransferase-like enzyme